MDWKQLLTSTTSSVNEELRLRNAYLMTENRILRHQIQGCMRLTDGERQALAAIGKKLGKKTLGEIATIAKAETILAWDRKFVAPKEHGSVQRKAPGRPRVDKALETLVVRIAQENHSWGYDRIVGSLANLGYTLSDQTVGNILKRHGIPPAPERKKTMTWREFIRIHMDLLMTTDFFTEVGTWGRLVIYVLLFFLPCDRLTLPVVRRTPLLKKRWMLLIALRSADAYASLERWVRLIKETVLSGFIPLSTAVVRPLLCGCDIRDPRAPSPQGKGKVVYMPMVNRPQIRDRPMRRQQRRSGWWTDVEREAA
jgi:putative transposase